MSNLLSRECIATNPRLAVIKICTFPHLVRFSWVFFCFCFVLFCFTPKLLFDFDDCNIIKIIEQLFYRMSFRLHLFEMSNVGYRVLVGITQKRCPLLPFYQTRHNFNLSPCL